MKRALINDRNISKGGIFFYLPLIFILIPSFPSILPELLGFQLIFALEVLVTLYLYKRAYSPQRRYNYLIILTYFVSITIFSLLNDVVKGVVVPSDFFELIKPLAFILFYWLYRYTIVDVEVVESQTLKAIRIIFLFLSMWSIFSFVFPSFFYPLELLLYKRESMAVHRGKAIGSFSQTYHFAYTLLLPLALSLIVLIQKIRIKYFLIFIIFLCAMLLTQSRSMYICTAVCLLVCIALPVHYRNIKMGTRTVLLIIVVVLSLLGIVLYYFDDISSNLSYAIQGFELMMSGENNSVNIRQSQVQWAIDNNPYVLIGAGIGKGEIMLESFYSLYYYRYGIIGLALSLLFTLHTSYTSYQIARNVYCKNKEISFLYYALFVFYLITPIATLSSCHMDSPKISFLFYGLMGMIYAKYSKLKYYEKICS